MTCLLQRSGMTPEPTPQDETANRSDGSAADGIEGDHTGHQERQDDKGCTALRSPRARPNTIPAPPASSVAVKTARPA